MKMTIMHNGVTATIDGTAEECARFLRGLSVGLVPTVGWGQPLPKVDLSNGPSCTCNEVKTVLVGDIDSMLHPLPMCDVHSSINKAN